MTRNRLALIGLVALVLAGFVSMSIYRVLRGAVNSSRANSLTTVVAAASDLPAGTRINEGDLRLVKMPNNDLPPGSFRTVSDAVGRAVTVPVVKGEPLLEGKLAKREGGAGLQALIPAGMRAVSVKVNDVISVAGFVTPGTRVDVLLTGQPGHGSDNEATATTVLEDVVVLAAGQKLPQTGVGEPQNATVITLLVSPEDAQKLALASQEGKIQLALRNPLDEEKAEIGSVHNSQLYGAAHQHEAAAPAAKARTDVHRAAKQAPVTGPPQQYVVEMIRGDKRDVAKFDQPKDAQ